MKTYSSTSFTQPGGSWLGFAVLVSVIFTMGLTACGSAGGNTETGDPDPPTPDPPEDTPPPGVPSALSAQAGDGVIALDWNVVSSSDLDGYRVYRSTQAGTTIEGMTSVNPSPVEASSFDDGTVTNGTTYFYRVTAVDTVGNESDGSDEEKATPLAGPPTRP